VRDVICPAKGDDFVRTVDGKIITISDARVD
jgi:hypothetical protein